MAGKNQVRIVYNRFPELAQRFPDVVRGIVRDTAEAVASYSREAMRQPKSGRVYKLSKNISHQASAPGEAPAVDTSALINSIQVEMTGKTQATVSTNIEYAAALEFGTSDGHIAARPFFRPAVRRVKDRFIELLRGLEARL